MTVAQAILNNYEYDRSRSLYRPCNVLLRDCSYKAFMEIPLDVPAFDIPLFAIGKFNEQVKRYNERLPMPSTLAACLYGNGSSSPYTSLDVIMKDILRCSFNTDRLIKVHLKDCEYTYYATKGAIFDEGLMPLAVQTYRIRRITDSVDGIPKDIFEVQQPVLWVNPQTYVEREDAVQRFIAGKMIKALAGKTVVCQQLLSQSKVLKFKNDRNAFCVRVILDCFPHPVQFVDTPSIATTDESLRALALKYKEDLIQ